MCTTVVEDKSRDNGVYREFEAVLLLVLGMSVTTVHGRIVEVYLGREGGSEALQRVGSV